MNNCTVLLEETPESYLSVINDQVITTSLKVAEIFGKLHKNVIQKIENLDCSPGFISANFSAHVENIEAGAVFRDSKYYEMTKDGFMFLVMSFTGKKAAQIKEAYINAFNFMAKKLANNNVVELPLTLTSEQCLHVRERIGGLVRNLKGNSFQLQYGKINRHFNKNSYKDILASDYPKICKYLNCLPRVDLQTQPLPKVEPLQNIKQLPFLNERILFTWENGVLVGSRPMASNEMTTTKESILKLVTYHDFTTVDERLELMVALNADLSQHMKDVSRALISERKRFKSMKG